MSARPPFLSAFRVTSPYGYRRDPFTGAQGAWHGGLDLVCDTDSTVHAVVGGTVAVSQIVTDKANRTWEWGNYVCVQGDDGNYIYYCHLASHTVRAGDRVAAGDRLGVMGATGHVTGTHLHFEVRNGKNVQQNAAAYLGIPNEVGEVRVRQPGASTQPGTPAQPTGDSTPQDWAREAVAWATANGILCGDGQGDLMLRQPCTREAAVTFLYRLCRLMGGQA